VCGSYSGDGIEVDNVDQPGSSVFMEEAWLPGSDTDLFGDALDNTTVQMHAFHHQVSLQTGQVAVNVIGGPRAAAGSWQGGATNIFAGASYGKTSATKCRTARMSVCGTSGTMAATAADKSPKSPERALSLTPAPHGPWAAPAASPSMISMAGAALLNLEMWGGGVPRPLGNFDCTNRDSYRRGG